MRVAKRAAIVLWPFILSFKKSLVHLRSSLLGLYFKADDVVKADMD